MNFDSFFVSRVSQPLLGRKPGELVRFWKTGQIQVLISKKITEEYLRVLAYPKFNLSEKEIGFLFNHEILPYFKAVRIKPGRWKTTIENDPSDDMFIRCAVSGMCKIIISDHISGDRHLPMAFTEQGVAMLSSVLKSDRAVEVNIQILISER